MHKKIIARKLANSFGVSGQLRITTVFGGQRCVRKPKGFPVKVMLLKDNTSNCKKGPKLLFKWRKYFMGTVQRWILLRFTQVYVFE